MVLDRSTLRIAERLRLNPRKAFVGRVRGERLTQRKGVSIEFSDFRDYRDGDDLRHLDWNALARLDTPVVKTYRDEEDLAVYLLLDVSPSMNFGSPTKLDYAKQVLCAFGAAGLAGGDAVFPVAMGVAEADMPPLRSRSGFVRLTSWLGRSLESKNKTLAKNLRSFATSKNRPGVVILATDCMDPEAPTQIKVLAGRGHEVWVVCILSQEELDPDIEGDLRLVDAEGGAPVELTVTASALTAYKQNVNEHLERLRLAATSLGGRFVCVSTQTEVNELFTNVLWREGWVTQ